MVKLFKNKKEPLYGRQTRMLSVKPFSVSTLKEILRNGKPKFKSEDLLALWTFTGGVAKYVELLVDNKALSLEKMIDFMVAEDSIFISEGKAILVEEFGKDYGTYFSILTLIARGKTTRNEIESALGKEIGGYLTKLEDEFGLIAENELEKRADFFEVKRQASKFDPKLLDGKINAFLLATGRFKNHTISGSGLSMSDML